MRLSFLHSHPLFLIAFSNSVLNPFLFCVLHEISRGLSLVIYSVLYALFLRYLYLRFTQLQQDSECKWRIPFPSIHNHIFCLSLSHTHQKCSVAEQKPSRASAFPSHLEWDFRTKDSTSSFILSLKLDEYFWLLSLSFCTDADEQLFSDLATCSTSWRLLLLSCVSAQSFIPIIIYVLDFYYILHHAYMLSGRYFQLPFPFWCHSHPQPHQPSLTL